jgi:hypothetical protein
MSKPNPWTAAKSRPVYIPEGARGRGRARDPVEPEYRFFVLMLEQLGCTVLRAHDGDGGHDPLGLFIMFTAPYELALRLAAVDVFRLSITGYTGHPDAPYCPGHWLLSWGSCAPSTAADRDALFREAARQMVRIFGSLARRPRT